MKITKLLSAGWLAATVMTMAAHAVYPERPVTLVVPFPPGGSTDLVARIVATKAQSVLGQAIIVENRGGAGSIIGTNYVAKAAPNGYTLLLGQTACAVNASFSKSLPYDTIKDFTPITLLADHGGIFLAQAQKPYDSFQEFVKYTKANPGKVVYSSAGVGSWTHLAMEMLANEVGLSMLHVPYQGTGSGRADLIAGRVDVVIAAYATSKGMIQDGSLKVLAVTSEARMPDLPNIPTLAELGYPRYDTSYWMGILGPAGMSAEVTAKLEKVFIEAVKDPAVAKKLSEQSIRPRGLPASDLSALIRKEIEQWARVIKDANVVSQ